MDPEWPPTYAIVTMADFALSNLMNNIRTHGYAAVRKMFPSPSHVWGNPGWKVYNPGRKVFHADVLIILHINQELILVPARNRLEANLAERLRNFIVAASNSHSG